MNLQTWLMTVLGIAVGTVLGWWVQREWQRRHAMKKQKLPAKWLLNARAMVNTEEQEIWNWLRTTFADHAVMVKVPVMRFTIPSTKDRPENKDQNWHELLEGVYCTFTVCTLGGKVVGCVDVPGKRGMTKAQREMKESLLLECGIGYTTVRNSSLPSGGAMRAAFLGEAVLSEAEAEETRGGDSSFHAALDEFTSEKVRAAKAAALKELNAKQAADADPKEKNRNVGFNPDGTGSFMTRDKPGRFATQWEDSYTHADNNRPGR
ncbi:DUF2726 domain-containing protein [Polaromonas sp. A23]|uniref:DUF2726 domain-containing protein n=1 Tax=Polaromonas sp. A23 TaxID=1944133 RepID=UPI0009872AD4|nr:DUF2726 domain-containing protein [Polaromonas sp. A23]OOG39445.1 hypothetical protein B0B52_15650 [Polaromonas sp. A23]